MAYIKKVSIEGLAGQEHQINFKLNRDINIFFGLNGSGKTSLLRILHATMANNTDLLALIPFKSAEITIYSFDYNTEYSISVKKKTMPNARSANYEIKLKLNNEYYPVHSLMDLENSTRFDKDLSQIRKIQNISISYEPNLPKSATGSWRHRYLPTWRLYDIGSRSLFHFKESNAIGSDSELDWDILFANSLNSLWVKYYTQVLSKVQKIQTDGLVSILKDTLSTNKQIKIKSLEPEIAYQNVLAFLKRQGAEKILGPLEEFAAWYNTDPKLKRIVDDINLIELNIAEAKKSSNKLENMIKDMFLQNKDIRFGDNSIEVVTKEGNNIGLNMLSAGEKQALKIFIETLMTDNCPLIIDEPEISLHLDWQKCLVNNMTQLNPDIQIILATHSPEIMADVADNKVFRL